MTTAADKKANTRRSASAEHPVLYRGIKIVPMEGARSPLAKAIREGLLNKKAEPSRGERK